MWHFLSNKNANEVRSANFDSLDRLGRAPSLSLTPEQGMAAVDEETVVPNLTHPDQEANGEEGANLAADTSQAHIFFKDLKLLADNNGEDYEEEEYAAFAAPGRASIDVPDLSPITDAGTPPAPRRRHKLVDRQKLVIILVGLPARGKTFICNKMMNYFNWLGHPTRHFNVGTYRRQLATPGSHQDAQFFDPTNREGSVLREKALLAALADMEAWLSLDTAQVAIFDATNSTESRRRFLRDRLHGRMEYMFLESVCNDQVVLEKNYRLKLRYSPDYKDMDEDQALADFRERIRKYELIYETMTDRTMHYVRLIDMVTGRGHMDVNRISGYIPGKMVFFLMQVCKALGRNRRIWLTRHGQSEFNVSGKIGGNSGLSPRGAAYAQLLPIVLSSRVPMGPNGRRVPVAVWTSTLQRTIATAAGLPYPKVQWKTLDEIQGGVCDGMTYREIKEEMPAEHAARKADKLRYRYPYGESYMDVIQRLEPVVIEVERTRECTCIVAHQAVLRALYGYFMNKPLEEVPRIEIPLHTVIELVPKADGTMAETRFHIDVDRALEMGGGHMDGDILEARIACGSTTDEEEMETSTSFTRQRRAKDADGSNSSPPKRSISMADLAAADLVAKEVIDDSLKS